jgi:hypothetical protein
MCQSKLESLLILSCERDKEINIEEAINTFGMTSSVLKKALMYT